MEVIVIALKILGWVKKNWKAVAVVAALLAAFAYVQWAQSTAKALKETRASLAKTEAALTAEKEAGRLAQIVADGYNKALAKAFLDREKLERKIANAMRSKDVSSWSEVPVPAEYMCARWGQCGGVLQPPGSGPAEGGN